MDYLYANKQQNKFGKYRDTIEITNSFRQVVLRRMPKMEKTSQRNAITRLYSEIAWGN